MILHKLDTPWGCKVAQDCASCMKYCKLPGPDSSGSFAPRHYFTNDEAEFDRVELGLIFAVTIAPRGDVKRGQKRQLPTAGQHHYNAARENLAINRPCGGHNCFDV